jgi:hypothetical protein
VRYRWRDGGKTTPQVPHRRGAGGCIAGGPPRGDGRRGRPGVIGAGGDGRIARNLLNGVVACPIHCIEGVEGTGLGTGADGGGTDVDAEFGSVGAGGDGRIARSLLNAGADG